MAQRSRLLALTSHDLGIRGGLTLKVLLIWANDSYFSSACRCADVLCPRLADIADSETSSLRHNYAVITSL